LTESFGSFFFIFKKAFFNWHIESNMFMEWYNV
jgi:hypothetical protein